MFTQQIHWGRQKIALHRDMSDRLFQISQEPKDNRQMERPTVIATCGKTAAQKLISALSVQETAFRYRVVAFDNPALPGMER